MGITLQWCRSSLEAKNLFTLVFETQALGKPLSKACSLDCRGNCSGVWGGRGCASRRTESAFHPVSLPLGLPGRESCLRISAMPLAGHRAILCAFYSFRHYQHVGLVCYQLCVTALSFGRHLCLWVGQITELVFPNWVLVTVWGRCPYYVGHAVFHKCVFFPPGPQWLFFMGSPVTWACSWS